MKRQHELIYTLDTLPDIVDDLVSIMGDCKILTFTGTLGAGKTTLIQAILNYYGIHENIQSPTFSYLNTYADAQGHIFYHFDLYRLKNTSDFVEAGFAEYLDVQNGWVFIEWPEIIKPLLKHKAVCDIAIDYYGEDRRRLRYFLE